MQTSPKGFICDRLSNRPNFALILAAGFSTRMGTCKTTLLWQGKTLLSYQAEQFLLAGMTPVIVLGSHNVHRQTDCPPECQIVVNPTPDRGKSSSILTGLRSLPRFSTLAISAVDQPRPTQLYQRLLHVHQYRAAPITAPTYRGRLGHPLFFSNHVLPDLQNIREETLGLRQVVQKFDSLINRVECDPNVLSDLNTPESYNRWRSGSPDERSR